MLTNLDVPVAVAAVAVDVDVDMTTSDGCWIRVRVPGSRGVGMVADADSSAHGSSARWLLRLQCVFVRRHVGGGSQGPDSESRCVTALCVVASLDSRVE